MTRASSSPYTRVPWPSPGYLSEQGDGARLQVAGLAVADFNLKGAGQEHKELAGGRDVPVRRPARA